jgi:hypothetical protein
MIYSALTHYPNLTLLHYRATIYAALSHCTNWTLFYHTKTIYSLLKVKKHIQLSGAGRGGAERPAACDLIRGNKEVDLFPRIKSQAAGRPAVCVFLP